MKETKESLNTETIKLRIKREVPNEVTIRLKLPKKITNHEKSIYPGIIHPVGNGFILPNSH